MSRRFRKGALVKSVPEFIAGVLNGGWFYLNDKPQNIAWLQNMNLRTLALFVEHGRVWYAEPNKGETNG